jgi:hypothetical protein
MNDLKSAGGRASTSWRSGKLRIAYGENRASCCHGCHHGKTHGYWLDIVRQTHE